MGGTMRFHKISGKETAWLLLSVITIGFCLSVLNRTALGVDPFTLFNLGIAQSLHLSLGNWQVIMNFLLFIPVLLFAREQIGWGTLANMFLVGYSFDFFAWLHGRLIPDAFFAALPVRVLITVPILTLFILAVSIYVAIQQGTAPYDALPYMIEKAVKKVPFKLVRMFWDLSFLVIGLLFGSKPGIVTIIMAFALGPAISYTDKHVIPKLFRR